MSLLILVVLALDGCGGDQGPSPFAGSWSGLWLTGTEAVRGDPLTLTIDVSGAVTGDIAAVAGGPAAHLVGSIRNEGNVELFVNTINPGAHTPVERGLLHQDADGHLRGDLTVTTKGLPDYSAGIDVKNQ